MVTQSPAANATCSTRHKSDCVDGYEWPSPHTTTTTYVCSQERTLLKRLQEELFPTMRRKMSLKKIASGQQWNNTESFMEGYRYAGGCSR